MPLYDEMNLFARKMAERQGLPAPLEEMNVRVAQLKFPDFGPDSGNYLNRGLRLFVESLLDLPELNSEADLKARVAPVEIRLDLTDAIRGDLQSLMGDRLYLNPEGSRSLTAIKRAPYVVAVLKRS